MAKNNTSPDNDDTTARGTQTTGTTTTGGTSKGTGTKGAGMADMARDAGEKITETAQQMREKVAQQTKAAARATAETLESNPFGIVAGAIALGAVAAALIPATRRELETLGPVTDRVKELVEEAYHAAREAGSSELTAAGLTAAAATNGFGGVVGALIKTASTAAGAAATTMRERRGSGQRDDITSSGNEFAAMGVPSSGTGSPGNEPPAQS